MVVMAGDRRMFSLRPVLFVWGWLLLYMVYANQIWSVVGFQCPTVKYTMKTDQFDLEVHNSPRGFSCFPELNGTRHNLNWTTDPLVPGTQYIGTFKCIEMAGNMTIYICANLTLWTKPGMPGGVTKSEVFIETETTPGKRNYLVTFKASEGNVHKYEMRIGDSNVCTFQKETTFLCSSLTPGKAYNYSITAYNQINDTSMFTESFTTKAIVPSSVTSLKVVTSVDNANISWNSPEHPNGKISQYVMSVTARDGYMFTSYFICNSPAAADAIEKCFMTGMDNGTMDNCSIVKQGSSCDQFSVQFLKLKPYAEYDVSIYAGNDVGQGEGVNETFMTEIGAANNVSDVTLTSKRNETTGLVELTIEWTPGALTGPTNYTIILEKETKYNSSEFSNDTLTVVNVTKYVVNNVKAFWRYRAHIVAATVKGESYSVPSKPHLTVESTPGVIRDLKVVQDEDKANDLRVSFMCLQQEESNGTIVYYVINHTPLNPNGEPAVGQMKSVNVSQPCPSISHSLTDLDFNKSYTIDVQAGNTECIGKISDGKNITVKPRKPQLKLFGKTSTIIKKNEMAHHTETEVSMTLCARCLVNNSQGEIKNVGLLVCVKHNHKSCNTSITDKLNKKYSTWKKARDSNFAQVYRTTPLDWVKDLHDIASKNHFFNYTVGDKSNCETELDNSYCNGPLPNKQTVIIYVIVCTSEGCDNVHSEDIMTKHHEESNTSTVPAAVVSTMMATLVVCFVIFFIFRKKPAFLPFKRKPQEVAEISHNRPVKLRGFEDHVRKLHKDSNLLFQDEFEEIRNLCMTFKTSCNEAQREANRIKNRYVDILPYDHSRVKLDVQPEDDETNDFINANYIPGLNSVREYIATQGPMNCTVPDFWRMVWEQKCHIIVMLSDLQESGKLKVDQYWPEPLNEPVNFENVIVEVTNFSQLNKYIIRNFRITKGDETRKVIQFFLPGWWDFSANLNFDDVLEFVKVVRLAATPEASGPIIVHCSAGVGRTGTLIALDYFIQYVDKCSLDDDMDIFHYVLQMRKNRPRMVQAESQYIFIFDAMLEVIKKKIESEEGRQSQSYGSCKDGDIEQRDEAPIVSIHLVDEKYAFINKAFEPDDSKNIANLPEEEKSTSKPEDSKSAANLPTENSTTESDQS